MGTAGRQGWVGAWALALALAACDPPHVERIDGAADLAPGAPDASLADLACGDDPGEAQDALTEGLAPPSAPLGAPCADADECASGFCVDGACCDSPCDGVCRACNLPDEPGHCALAAPDTDPRADCAQDGTSLCGGAGVCDGAGRCAVGPASVVCQAPRCAGTLRTLAMTCDGAGECSRGGDTVDCTPYRCGSNADCLSHCTSSADCASGYFCNAGSCGKRPTGAVCAADADCNSGFCRQGRCCVTTCDGVCTSCALAGREGACSPVPAGQDPLDQCADKGAQSCDLDGACDGQGACRRYGPGTSCAAPVCSGGAVVGARTCDGKGTCLPGMVTPCDGYACIAAACRASCASNADCASPAVCLGSACGLAGALHVMYAAGDTSTNTYSIRPRLRIDNAGTLPVPLDELELRYWYTRSTNRQQYVECTSAAVGCAGLSATVVPLATTRTGADTYVRVAFPTSVADIAAGGTSGEIDLRVWQEPTASCYQTNDYSFDASKTTLTAWTHVTLYRTGALVWGTEP